MSNNPITNKPSRLVGCFWIVVCALVSLAINVTVFALQLVLYPNRRLAFIPTSLLSIIGALIALLSVLVDLRMWRFESTPTFRKWAKMQKLMRNATCFLAFSSVIASLTTLTLEGIRTDGTFNAYFDLRTPAKAVLAVLSCTSIISDALLGGTVARFTWHPVHRAARSAMIISSLLQFAVGTLLVAANWQPFLTFSNDADDTPTTRHNAHAATFAMHEHAGTFISVTAALGFAVCVIIREGDRINQLYTRFIRFYLCAAAFTGGMCSVLVVLSTEALLDSTSKSQVQKATLISDPVLVGCALCLLVINFIAAGYLQAPPASNLAVEIIDLASLTPRQREGYAALINKHGKHMPGAPNGEAAISLMQAYSGASMANTTCMVLRVYKPVSEKRRQQQQQQKQQDTPDTEKLLLDDDETEDDLAWRGLDEEKMVLRQEMLLEEPEPAPAAPAKLTRAQQKKLAKKQATAAAAGETVRISLETLVDEEVDKEFNAKLASTEALLLMTVIKDYDLSSSVQGWAGNLLQRTLGARSWSKVLCVRLGLLAFQYPFRQSTFYCSSARRPVARSAAVLRAIAEWNKNLPSSERCTVLLDPTYQHEAAERAIAPSGWQPTPLPASHIIDLRRYKGMTLPEYLKAIKYRDQEAAFKRASGEVVESTAFTEEECAEVMRMWHQIADKRTSGGETAVLAKPDELFLRQLGGATVNNGSDNAPAAGDRSLMFLRANGGQNVASCVLFRLGDTITSDLQGLDYEHARPLKAYFVMMQHVIAIALREGYSFVDFGPTTAKPKMDIGCKSVPLVAAMYAQNPIVSAAIGIAAANTSKKMMKE